MIEGSIPRYPRVTWLTHELRSIVYRIGYTINFENDNCRIARSLSLMLMQPTLKCKNCFFSSFSLDSNMESTNQIFNHLAGSICQDQSNVIIVAQNINPIEVPRMEKHAIDVQNVIILFLLQISSVTCTNSGRPTETCREIIFCGRCICWKYNNQYQY